MTWEIIRRLVGNSSRGEEEGYVKYLAGNTDKINQRDLLISLWLMWAFFAEEILEKR